MIEEDKMTKKREDLIAEIMRTMDTPENYPRKSNGRPDFDAELVKIPVLKEDVGYLVDRCLAGESVRTTYGILYRQDDIAFDPHGKIAALRAGK
jgi:hypothetical protein